MANKISIDKKAVERIQEKIRTLSLEVANKPFLTKLGLLIIQKMKQMIKSGLSSVQGSGLSTRMPGYKNPDKYPGDLKNPRPVNLYLSGQMLNNLGAEVRSEGKSLVLDIGYTDNLAKQKEEGHATGHNSQPKRPTIPTVSDGQDFAKSIQTIMLGEFRKELKKRIK